MNKITVIYHSADYDGEFCREVAKKFLGTEGVEYIGWNFGDAPLQVPAEGIVFVMDLPVDRVFGQDFHKNGHPTGIIKSMLESRFIWIDHHKSSIETHPNYINGYRNDGVAACRLAYQWFSITQHNAQNQTNEIMCVPLPTLADYGAKLGDGTCGKYNISEPYALRLAGEYDIWDKRNPDAETFQSGLRAQALTQHIWNALLDDSVDKSLQGTGMESTNSELMASALLQKAPIVKYVRDQEYAEVINGQGFTVAFENLTFLACCSHELDIRSQLFEGAVKPEHDALIGFTYTGTEWKFSMYHAPGKEHHDLSVIARAYGGGGHKGACGFHWPTNPLIHNKVLVKGVDESETLAGHLYETYCKEVGGKAFNGDPLPKWPEFRADANKKKQSDAWVATARAAICI